MTIQTPTFNLLSLARHDGNIFVITLDNPPENRLSVALCQEIIAAFHHIHDTLSSEHGPPSKASRQSPGAIVTTTKSQKFFSTGLDLTETASNPLANTTGFYPLLYTVLDSPYPTIACLTGHTYGGACPLALAHDYRVMSSSRGYFCMPPVDLGLHFDGIGALPRAKLRPEIARTMLLEAARWTGEQALRDGIVDAVAVRGEVEGVAMEFARGWAGKAKGGVYGVLRGELVGEALRAFAQVSYVRRRRTGEHL